MKITQSLLIAVVVAGFLSGCAGTPKDDQSAAEPTPEPTSSWSFTGPSRSDAEKSIASAKAAIKSAKVNDWQWRDTGKIMKKAEAAFDKEDYEQAVALSEQAERQANGAVNQYYLESAKDLRRSIAEYSLDDAQRAKLDDVDTQITRAEGRAAYDAANALVERIKASVIHYNVMRGDNLWRISGKSDIYNNPYQWPLIYKHNADQIKDADLIYPGQHFKISRSPSASEVQGAVNHAKTRGAWSVGPVEASDRAYLRR